MRRRAAAVLAGGLFGTALTGALLAGPAALADDLEINPSSARPGESVTIEGACGKGNDAMATITSPALPTQQADVGDRGWFSSEVTVKHVKPKSYTVTMNCNMSDKQATGTLNVKPARETAYPDGGPMTGGGAMAGAAGAAGAEADGEAADGGGFPWGLTGAALAAGAAGVGGLALLRARARGRG